MALFSHKFDIQKNWDERITYASLRVLDITTDQENLQRYLPDEALRKKAISYAKENKTGSLLFTMGGTWYMPIPDRLHHPEYIEYLQNDKNITDTVAIAAKKGHAFPVFIIDSSGYSKEIHVGTNVSDAYYRGKRTQPVRYSIGPERYDNHNPAVASLIIGVNTRQQNVLEADYYLASANPPIDMPTKTHYLGGHGKPDVTNCAEFSIDFLENVGITGLPQTNSANHLMEMFGEYASNPDSIKGDASISFPLDLERISRYLSCAERYPDLEPCLNPTITVRQIDLGNGQPVIAIDGRDAWNSIKTISKGLEEKGHYIDRPDFYLEKIISVMRRMGCYTQLGQLDTHYVSGKTTIETLGTRAPNTPVEPGLRPDDRLRER